MILPIHILIAICSLAYTTYVFLFPSKQRLGIAEVLVGATLISGIVLVVAKPASMAHVCVTGISYLAVVSFGLFMATRRLHA